MAIPENPITRKEHFLAKAAGESVNTPDPITREEMYLDAIASGSGGGGSGGGGGGSALPAVTSDDDGKVLSVVDGAWAADDNRFVVVCTPTAADFSGTMDKTVEEILGAYAEGKSICLQVINVGTFLATASAYGSFGTDIVDSNNDQLIHVFTARTGNRYYTRIYQLTPMGG